MEAETLKIDEWEILYSPLQDDEGEIFYHPSSDGSELSFDALIEKASEFVGGNKKAAYRHIWTRVDYDGKLYLVNGIHVVNRLDYCITEKPWWTGRGDDTVIEVEYEEAGEY